MTKIIKIIFTLSLLLNLTFIGFVSADYYKKYQHSKVSKIMDERTRDIVSKLKPPRSKIKERMQLMRKNRAALKDVISAEEFDLNAYQNTIDKIMNQKDEMARARANKMGETILQLSQEDRISLSNHMLKRMSGHKNTEERSRKRSDPRRNHQ